MLLKQRKTQRNVAQIFSCSQPTVSKISRKSIELQSLKNYAFSDRPQAASARQDRNLWKKCKNMRCKSTNEISNEYRIEERIWNQGMKQNVAQNI